MFLNHENIQKFIISKKKVIIIKIQVLLLQAEVTLAEVNLADFHFSVWVLLAFLCGLFLLFLLPKLLNYLALQSLALSAPGDGYSPQLDIYILIKRISILSLDVFLYFHGDQVLRP